MKSQAEICAEFYYQCQNTGLQAEAAYDKTRRLARGVRGSKTEIGYNPTAGNYPLVIVDFPDHSTLYLTRYGAAHHRREAATTPESPMKTQAIMLPSHGGEDQQVATLYHYDNGDVIVESPNATRHLSMAHALEHIRTRWPWAYVAEPVRDDTPPPSKGPTLADLIAAVNRCNRYGMHTLLSYDARSGHMHIIPAHSSGRFEIDTNNCTADEITCAVVWLNKECHHHTTNPNH